MMQCTRETCMQTLTLSTYCAHTSRSHSMAVTLHEKNIDIMLKGPASALEGLLFTPRAAFTNTAAALRTAVWYMWNLVLGKG